MSIFSKVAKATIIIGGKGVEYGIKGTGCIASEMCNSMGKKKLSDNISRYSSVIGNGVGFITKKGGEVVERGVDKTIRVAGYIGAETGGYIAEKSGLDVKLSRKVGAAIGGGTVGLLAGEVVGSSISAITAVTSTASTGTAISALHGAAAANATFAHIGGGALSAGGGGIAAGHAILNTIDVSSSIAGGVSAVNSDNTSKITYVNEYGIEFI